jgi:hypothetical protein
MSAFAVAENSAQHGGQVAALERTAGERVWLDKALREATLVDGDHEARQHVEIDIGLVARLLEQ